MKISVMIVCYNSAAQIGEAIDCVLSQTFSDFELLVVDDGSADNTAEIVQGYAAQDARVQYHFRKNGGPAAARNTALALAKGEYLFFLDSDDRIAPNALEALYSAAQEHQAQITCCGYTLDRVAGGKTVETPFLYRSFAAASQKEFAEHLTALTTAQMLYVVWNKLYRADFVREVGATFPPMFNGEDRMFNTSLNQKVERFCFVNEALYHYRVNENGITVGRFFPEKYDWAHTNFVAQRELFELLGQRNEQTDALLCFLFLKVVVSCVTQLYAPTCPYDKKEKLRYVSNILSQSDFMQACETIQSDSRYIKIMRRVFLSRSPKRVLRFAWGVVFAEKHCRSLFLKIKYRNR